MKNWERKKEINFKSRTKVKKSYFNVILFERRLPKDIDDLIYIILVK